MAVSKLIQSAAKSFGKRGKKIVSSGRVASKALDGASVGGLTDYRNLAEELWRTNQISQYEWQSTLANPRHKPLTWVEQQGKTWDGLPKEQGSEYAVSKKRSPGEHINATLSLQEGISGIHNPLHRVIKDPDQALEVLTEAQIKIGNKIKEHKARADWLRKLRDDPRGPQPFPHLDRKTGRPDGTFSSAKGKQLLKRYDSEITRAERSATDLETTPPAQIVAEWLDSMADPGYGAAAGKPGGKPVGQVKGMSIDEIIEQHHGIPNAAARDMFKQTAFVNEVFKINVWQYIAKQYKVGMGKSRANMWNIPKDIHVGKGSGLHAWLTELGFDDYWAKLLDQNPNMSQQEIMNAIDKYFDDIFYPTLIKVESMVMNAPKKKWSNLHLPKEALKEGKERLAQLLDEVDTWTPVTFADRSPVAREQAIENLIDASQGGQVHSGYAFSPPPEPGVGREVLTQNLSDMEAGKTFGAL